MSERIETLEFSGAELELIDRLKSLGPDNQEARESLVAWVQAEEVRANEINSPRANNEFDVKRAKLYRAAGFTREAWDILETMRVQLYSAGETDIYDEVMRIMDEMDEVGS